MSTDDLLGRTGNSEEKLHGQPKVEKSDRIQDFIEMCFVLSVNAHAKFKETIKTMLEK